MDRSSSLIASGVVFWYGPLASASLQIASMGLDQHGKKVGVPTSGQGSVYLPNLMVVMN